MNVQRYAPPCPIPNQRLYERLWKLSNRAIENDGHTFCDARNFGLRGKHLTLVDYGSPKTQSIVLSHGAKIAAEFDPDLC